MSNVIAEVEACIPALRRYASALLRNRQEVDDLVQDCLVRALDRLHSRRPDADLRAWLFTIMHNLFISRLRHAKVRGRVETMDAIDEAAIGQRPAQEGHMRGKELLRALSELPEEQRAVLLLVAVEDFSYADAARVTGVPVGTVMSRLSRAREKLRRSVDEPAPAALRRVK
jgi:RNA polymerase sigma factor (sigma-70 family)